MSEQEDEEEDYMSDKYLQQDNKPGLMPKCFLNKHKRAEDGKARGKQSKTKSLKVHAAEQREEKLSKALDETNKGFAMLSKMGFKAGMGLGKKEQGRSEPIPIQIKEGRKGLGKDKEETRHKAQRVEAYKRFSLKRRAVEENLRGDFKSRMRSKLNERQTEMDLRKSQGACQQLDNKKNLQPKYEWMWLPVKNNDDEEQEEQEEEEEQEEQDEIDAETKLRELTTYLRHIHFYCVWCGVEYEDEEDLNSHCPGNTKEDHDD